MKILSIIFILAFSMNGFSAPIYEPISVKDRLRLDLWYYGVKELRPVEFKKISK